MDINLLIQTISAGICLYAGGMHFLIGLRRLPRAPVHLSFSMLASLFGVYSLDIFALYIALDISALW